ncbi:MULTISPECIES: rod shape-determining protein MreD [unclassified Capnocytophaga]|jgi:rod shape-determining protein MreD|uniref:rod shape-determining protein MreD n=1 Tax=unclassified Capnocytophaga TaxID=2640652 RepID=UPI000202C623|nr:MULTISPECIES: rod shape-determining protein MreD [unclassified Capnocytophaga]EGD33506.1 hypothetical protein HMPREF9071_2001 [Capnocytophaga sp. oral taxon 338 str. F0234]MEB3004209.1 rod shape-determining protein MreD [Capnocytophaga sp. G2]
MNNLIYIFQLLGWVLLQGIILSNINLFGYVNPALYLLFFMTFPFFENKTPLLILAVLAGLIIDILSHTGGVYTCATLCVVFLRPILVRLFFGQTFDEQFINLRQVSLTLRILYIFSFVLIFHLIFSILETFQWQLWLFSLHKTLINVLFSGVVCLLVEQIIGNPKRKEESYR